jgi:hypothetical protein
MAKRILGEADTPHPSVGEDYKIWATAQNDKGALEKAYEENPTDDLREASEAAAIQAAELTEKMRNGEKMVYNDPRTTKPELNDILSIWRKREGVSE